MNDNQRFSVLTFPQSFDGAVLSLNIVVLPRDQNPLAAAIEQHGTIPDAPAFADAQWTFTLNGFDSLSVFPHTQPPIANLPVPTEAPAQARAVFQAIAPQLEIVNLNTTNRNIDLVSLSSDYKPPSARAFQDTVRKYLPLSYRKAFNFVRPRNKNLVTDDSYHCALKDAQLVPGFQRSPNAISWGKVFAYLMRQPLLARQVGFIYASRIAIDPSAFANGGWIYVDLAPSSDYRSQLDVEPDFVRRYAARLPALEAGVSRPLFAPVQFPVLFKGQPSDPDPSPGSDYSRLFIEAAEYDDGFAKIVHCRQPPNRDRMAETPDGAYPVKDVGVEAGWDDEAITERYIRQMVQDPSGELSGRVDAPLGVFGYVIDVRQAAEPENPWESLNAVQSRQPLTLPGPDGQPIVLGEFDGELPFQVYPMQVDGRKHLNYWLPMYFANWIGHSMVLPDPDAAEIYKTTNVDVLSDPLDPVNNTGTGVTGPAQNQLNQMYRASALTTALRYGRSYEFRVRMQDLSGGAPTVSNQPVNATASDIAPCRFRRFIAPNQPRVRQLSTTDGGSALVNSDVPSAIDRLSLQRPKLGYPAVVFTGKYAAPVPRLVAQANLGLQVDPTDVNVNAEHRVGLGIADPDVDRIEVAVEVASLKLDKLASVSGKEDYVHLYTTTRSFPPITDDDDYEAVLDIPVEYRDIRVLRTGDDLDLVDDFNLETDIDALPQLVLPTGRTVRLTVRAVCEDKGDNDEYFGLIEPENKRRDVRFGEPIEFMAYAPSNDETALMVQVPGVPPLQGIFLQSDVTMNSDGRVLHMLLGKKGSSGPSNIQQLAGQLDVTSNGLTLSAKKGQRVVFGCSSRIRHTLSADGSSVSFAAKGDLVGHWLCCISFDIDRDWMWDALEHRSLIIRRTKRFTRDAAPIEDNVVAGDLSLVRTASHESLHGPTRTSTRVVFIDAVEPKKVSTDGAEPDFPDTIDLTYTIEPRFKSGHGQLSDPIDPLALRLPVTTAPAQVPRIVSAGIAQSPYVRNETYSASQVRKRFLWIEFAEAIKDPQDTYFARVLAVAPDQLLSNNTPQLLAAPEEPALAVDPEPMRVITDGATNDLAGLPAMQPMQPSTSSDRHYLLPLPPGLHADSDEMFGFFTYEFRVGHFRAPATDAMVWTTGIARYGRPLRTTGIQHPPPALTCMPNRDDNRLWVTAPYAAAVHEGKNVTAEPPRTQLWALLYAQVQQADGQDYRNILLDDRELDWRVQVEPKPNTNPFERYTDKELRILQAAARKAFKFEIHAGAAANNLKLVTTEKKKNKDATKYGTAIWTQNEIIQLLGGLGLPLGSSLSVLVVEVLPQVTNIFDQVSGLSEPRTAEATAAVSRSSARELQSTATVYREQMLQRVASPSPVSDQLGHHRLLRTSPLTEVPEVCPPK